MAAMSKTDFSTTLRNRIFGFAGMLPSKIDIWNDWQKNVEVSREEGFNQIQWSLETATSGQIDRSGSVHVQEAPSYVPLTVDFAYGLAQIQIDHKAWLDISAATDNVLLASGTINQVQRSVDREEARIKENIEIELMTDGTGRRAKVAFDDNGSDKWITLLPAYTQCASYSGSEGSCTPNLYVRDSLKLLRIGDRVDVGPLTGAYHCTNAKIVDMRWTEAASSYGYQIQLDSASTVTSIVAGDWVYLHNNRAVMTESAGVITVTTAYEMSGLEAMIGDGASDGTYYGQGLYSLYGKTSADSSFHKSYVTRGTTWINTQTWTDDAMMQFELEWINRGGLWGNPSGQGVSKEPVLVNGVEKRPVWILAAPYTMRYLKKLASQSQSPGHTVFREINAGDVKEIGYGGAELVYKSQYLGDVPIKTYWRMPEGKLFWVRPDQMLTEYKGEGIVHWVLNPNKQVWADNTVNYGLADMHVATLRTITQVHTRARNRCAAMINIALS